MPNICVVGMQWGDEGKARIVDLFTDDADIVVRTGGGANAGHTVVVGDEVFKFHLVPSGILHKDKECVIGNGVVVDPEALFEETDDIQRRGYPVTPDNLHISDRAHVVMPYHKWQDAMAEDGAETKLGTTLRGIGPCYADKMLRVGVRMADMLDGPALTARLDEVAAIKNKIFAGTRFEGKFDRDELVKIYSDYAERLRPYVMDTSVYLNKAIRENRRILFEGAQATLLDIDHGTYPYVTSSNASACGVSAGAGIPPKQVGHVVGIVKAYTTRVGEGPFPTELHGEAGEAIRKRGAEYGATTGRPRRCGWLDIVALKHATQINGVDGLALTKLDVLTGEKTVKVAVAYNARGVKYETFPCSAAVLADVEPEYIEFEGWTDDITSARKLSDLPKKARTYLDYIVKVLEVPIEVISVGPERDQTVVVND